jgi:hypothetical protein
MRTVEVNLSLVALAEDKPAERVEAHEESVEQAVV